MSINYLVISALGEDRPGIVNELSKTIFNSGCNIADSRMTVLGGDFAVLLLVSGKWNELAKLESHISPVADELGLTISIKKTAQQAKLGTLLPYAVEVVAIDHPGIVYHLAEFFSKREINVEELSTNTYQAPHTGASMFSVQMTIGVPSQTHIGSLREEFMDFCDQRNLDSIIEPVKI